MNLKVFELKQSGETFWIAAHTSIHALNVYLYALDMHFIELSDSDDIREMSEEEVSVSRFTDGKSFTEYLKGVNSPQIIAGTPYN